MMGSGGVIVMDEETCMVDMARFFMEFTQDESCGKCAPCRVGTSASWKSSNASAPEKARRATSKPWKCSAHRSMQTSLCGLGQGAPNPVISYTQAISARNTKRISTKNAARPKYCKALIRYEIEAEPCTGCTVCARNCPVNAISGERRQTPRDRSGCLHPLWDLYAGMQLQCNRYQIDGKSSRLGLKVDLTFRRRIMTVENKDGQLVLEAVHKAVEQHGNDPRRIDPHSE